MGSHAMPPWLSDAGLSGAGDDDPWKLLARALDTPWLGTIEPNDLRFGFTGADSLLALCQRIDGGEPALYTQQVRQTLRLALAAAENTYAKDVREVGEQLALRRFPSAARLDSRHRFVDCFIRRAGCGDAGWTLEDIGRVFGVTREAIRLVMDRGLEAASGVSIACASTFRLEQTLTPCLPLPCLECDERAAQILGTPAPLEAVMHFLTEVQRKPLLFGFRYRNTRGRNTRFVEVVEAPVGWHRSAWSTAQWCSEASGGAQVDLVAGRVMFEHGIALDRERFVAILEAHPDFRWLAKDAGWFTVEHPAGTTSVTRRVAKIMAVAQRPVDLDEIAGALMADWRMAGRRPVYALPLPPFALQGLLASLPWLEVRQRNNFLPGPTFDAAAALTDTDRALVGAIEQRHGVATRQQIVQSVMQACGITSIAVSMALSTAPYLRLLGHSLYALVGRDINPAALAAAMAVRSDFDGAQPAAPGPDGVVASWRIRVTEASLRNEQYMLPRRVRDALAAGPHAIRGSPAEVTVYRSGVLRGANRHFGGLLRPGDVIEAQAFADGSVALSRAGGEPTAV